MIEHQPHYLNYGNPVVQAIHNPIPYPHPLVHVHVHHYHAPHHQVPIPSPQHHSDHTALTDPRFFGHLHEHGHVVQNGHTVHITMYTHHVDVTKTVWMWHITNHRGELVKVSSEVHKTLVDCVINIGQHETKLVHLEETEISKSKWTWRISRHNGDTIKSSAKIHISLKECLADLRTTGSSVS